MLLSKENVILGYILVAAVTLATPSLAQWLAPASSTAVDLKFPTLERLDIESEIMTRYAETRVTCQMYNRYPTSTMMNFSLLLPEDALISAFSMISDGTEYKAALVDSDFADETYSRIESLDEEAGLVAQWSRDANIFEVSMTARPFRRVTFVLTQEQLLKRENGLYTLPIHIHPGELSDVVSVTVTINETSPIRILQVSELQNYGQDGVFQNNSLAKITRPTDRSAIITWNPTKKYMRNPNIINGVMSVQYDVTANNEILLDEDGNFLQIFQDDSAEPLPKHVVFVLDRSGSMTGLKMEKMVQALSTILDNLSARDSFSLIFFSSQVKIWTGSGDCNYATEKGTLQEAAVLSATGVNKSKAKKCIGLIKPVGGTDIDRALNKALDASKVALQLKLKNAGGGGGSSVAGDTQLLMMFLTDGKANGIVRDPLRIAQTFTEKNAHVGASLFGLAFGQDADFNFLKKITLQNGGFAKRIYEADDAAQQLENFFRTISTPVLSNVKFVYDKDKQVRVETPKDVPILFNGSSVMQAGSVGPGGVVSGVITSDEGQTPMPQPTLVSGKQARHLDRLKAYLTIRTLLDRADQQSRERARDLALQNHFVTRLTSLIVTRPDEDSVIPYEEPSVAGRSASFSPIETHEVVQDRMETPFTGLGLEDIPWLIPLGNDSYAMPDNEDFATNMEIGVYKDVVRYSPCNTPEDASGHCYHLHHCVLPDFLDDFRRFADYFCTVQKRFVGVCCPDEYTTPQVA